MDQEQVEAVARRYRLAVSSGESEAVLQDAAEHDDWFAWFLKFTGAKHKSLGKKGRLPKNVGLASLREICLMLALELAKHQTELPPLQAIE